MARDRELDQLLTRTGTAVLTASAYDMGWVARLGDIDAAIAGNALEWLRRNQLPDGAWGAPGLVYHHDRVICTLSAITALARHGDAADRERIDRARPGLAAGLRRLDRDTAGETIGFELVAPMLFQEAEELGLVSSDADAGGVLARLRAERDRKLGVLSPGMITNRTSLAHSAELAWPDNLGLLSGSDLLLGNGSVGFSPAATAFYASTHDMNDAALTYLKLVTDADGAVPNVGPIDVFEISWTLWNLGLTAHQPAVASRHRELLERLVAAWTPGRGTSFGAGFTPEDGDDTALVFEVLTRYGMPRDLEAVLSYAGPEHFYTWPTERNSSISTNVHVLGALGAAGLPAGHPMVEKVLSHLTRRQDPGGYWVDKWHTSPYYPTTHAVVTGASYPGEPFRRAVRWILGTQRPDGSWGHFRPTAEETAYCLQALVIASRTGEPVPRDAITRGHAWLSRHAAGPHPWLYIGKCLYSPDIVVESAVLSALALAEEEQR